jgi:hypothetical protein
VVSNAAYGIIQRQMKKRSEADAREQQRLEEQLQLPPSINSKEQQ